MKKAIIPILTAAISVTLFTACHHDSLEDRAERDARDYTERYCPTPFTDNQRTDSITFTRTDKTFHYFTRFATKPTTQKSSISTKPV